MRLFCFTFAGGTAQFFDILRPELEPELTLTALEYAGHGTRRHEPFYADFNALAADMYAKLKAALCPGEPYALFGYSMGSIAAAEVLQRILSTGEIPPPRQVFLAAHEPHSAPELRQFSSGEADELVKARTVRFGGIPPQLLENKSFWRMYLPVYRADYAIIGSYDFDSLSLRCDIPADVFYSPQDTPLEGMTAWQRYFTARCAFHSYEGTHLFIQQHSSEMAAVIRERLQEP